MLTFHIGHAKTTCRQERHRICTNPRIARLAVYAKESDRPKTCKDGSREALRRLETFPSAVISNSPGLVISPFNAMDDRGSASQEKSIVGFDVKREILRREFCTDGAYDMSHQAFKPYRPNCHARSAEKREVGKRLEPAGSLDGMDAASRLIQIYKDVRRTSAELARVLSPEDCQIQSMPDASPVKWHLAHTTWFFETFVLKPYSVGFELFHPSFSFLYNSYYNAIGDRLPRPRRGLMSRPTLDEVYAYRAATDRAMETYLARACGDLPDLLLRRSSSGSITSSSTRN